MEKNFIIERGDRLALVHPIVRKLVLDWQNEQGETLYDMEEEAAELEAGDHERIEAAKEKRIRKAEKRAKDWKSHGRV